jgi:hypothetical protein
MSHPNQTKQISTTPILLKINFQESNNKRVLALKFEQIQTIFS